MAASATMVRINMVAVPLSSQALSIENAAGVDPESQVCHIRA
jgi:hypothetical protein